MDYYNTFAKKKRHGCLTAYLILIFTLNLIGAFSQLITFFFAEPIMYPDSEALTASIVPRWLWLVLGIGSIIKLVSTVAILNWKKWGFWLFTISVVIRLIFNFYTGLYIANGIFWLVGIAILYGALNVGKKNGWRQLD